PVNEASAGPPASPAEGDAAEGPAAQHVAAERLPVLVVEQVRDVETERPVLVELEVADEGDDAVVGNLSLERADRPAEGVAPAVAEAGVEARADEGEVRRGRILGRVRQQQAVEAGAAVLDLEVEPGVGEGERPAAVDRPVDADVDPL